MEMHQVTYFLAICDTLNFTRAAEHCHVSQPALSFAIKKLEEEVGGALFTRERNAVSLTRLGAALHPRLLQIQEETKSAFADAWRVVNFEQQLLRMGVLVTVGATRLAAFLAHFQRMHSNVFVELSDGRQEDLFEALRGRRIDVAILNPFEPLGPEFEMHPLYSERYVACFPPGHRFEQRRFVRMRELSGEPYVDRLACEMREMAHAALGEMDIVLNARFRSDREDWVQGMVLSGRAVTVLPEQAILVEGICTKPLVEPELSRQVSAVTRKEPEQPEVINTFLSELKVWRWDSGETAHAAMNRGTKRITRTPAKRRE